jgi:hypothetical protein
MSLISYSKEKANEGIQQTYDRLANDEITPQNVNLLLERVESKERSFIKEREWQSFIK